jgi:hypothetical protein
VVALDNTGSPRTYTPSPWWGTLALHLMGGEGMVKTAACVQPGFIWRVAVYEWGLQEASNFKRHRTGRFRSFATRACGADASTIASKHRTMRPSSGRLCAAVTFTVCAPSVKLQLHSVNLAFVHRLLQPLST